MVDLEGVGVALAEEVTFTIATFFQISFLPLFTHLTGIFPDLAVAPTFVHLLPGALAAATPRGSEKRISPKVKVKSAIEVRLIRKRLRPHLRKY